MTGVILKAISGFYYVSAEGQIYECKARGNFRNNQVSPTVGDKVEFSVTQDLYGIVEKVFDRKNILTRPLIANMDKIFIVSSYTVPAPDTLMIDRLTAIASFHGIEPIIVFNKCDMGDFCEFEMIYKKSGFKTYVVSAKDGIGIEKLKNETKDCISAFIGNSGVGKSSILNAVFGDLQLKTGEVSKKLGRGRHTTRHTELFPHKFGGFVADTPGFSSLETMAENSYEFKVNLAECYRDFKEYLGGCRFTSCTHTCEKGCAILDAVNKDLIEESRHNSYKIMFDELKGVKSWNSK